MIKKNIPNFFTSLNFICGCLASYFAFKSLFEAAFILVLIGVFFDLFDGFFARLFKVESNFGLQFDSMADLITSGLVPGIVMYKLFLQVGLKEIDFIFNVFNVDFIFSFSPLALIGFIIPLSSAIRLTRFNLDDSQKDEFNGLPAPANALFIVSLPILYDDPVFNSIRPFIFSFSSLLVITFLSSIMMNLRFRLFSFKLNSYKLYENFYQIIFVLVGIVLFYFFNWISIPILIIVYIIINIFRNYFK
ncbi:MAG: phosphatidylserine synthase [Flavobacteriaceae bacterium]|nr:phosphatidylserine synthase [Flavobacteriaceae bacterium]|tara:strand:+ start:8872 stop:9612 length:741 start_codon:yes stop_codon:yes gene_type:complete